VNFLASKFVFKCFDLYRSASALCAKPLFVPPILQVLAFPRRRDDVRRWAERVAQWDFQRIIPSHLDGPIDAGPKEFAEVRL
jgi:hypothetical protein